jgi:hypothetical protein
MIAKPQLYKIFAMTSGYIEIKKEDDFRSSTDYTDDT